MDCKLYIIAAYPGLMEGEAEGGEVWYIEGGGVNLELN